MAVKNNLREICLAKGIKNQWQLSKVTGISHNTAKKFWEDNNYVPTAEVMNAVCCHLELQPGDFLFYEYDRE